MSRNARPAAHARAGPAWEGPPPSEICIVMLSALGDAVHVLPVANALKRAWPESRITWVVQPVAKAFAEGHPAIDELVTFERRQGPAAFRSFLEIRRAMRGRRFDVLLGLQVYFKANLIAALTSAEVKLGFDWRRARDAQWLFTNRRIPAHRPQHVQDQYFEFLRYLGVDPEPVTWNISLSEHELEAQARFFRDLDRPVCAVVVGTSKPEKDWHPSRMARVLDEVEQTHGLRPMIVGGGSPAERRNADEIIERSSATIIDTLGDDVRRLLWLLEGSALLITPDTGPLHIARAVGTPTISLFGYTNPKRSGPYKAFGNLVVDGYAEYPGEDYDVNGAYRDGMKRVTVEEVLEKVSHAMKNHVKR